MANLIPDGEYYILNAAANIAGTPRCIDVSGAQLLKENAKVQLYDMLRNNAQAFQVRNSGGKLIITSRLYGNRFGPTSTTATSDVKLNVKATGVPTNTTWTIIAAGTTCTHGGVTYDCYSLRYGNFYLTANGTGNNAVLRTTQVSSNNAHWYFIPISQIDEGGLVELRPVIATNMALDVEANGQNNGTNVRLWTANDTNAQKFYLDRKSGTEDQYTLRAIGSGKYVDVDSALAKHGTNVQIWDKNNTRAQDWRVLEYGKQTINGIEGKILSFGSMVSGNGNSLMMDVQNYGTKLNTNIVIANMNNSTAQRFVALPTTAEDPHMPVPHSLGLSDGSKTTRRTYGYTDDDSYLSWSCSAAWCTDNGANHYELRYRTRTMHSIASSWRSWSDWTAWTIPAIETSGQSVWSYVEGALGEYTWDDANNQQTEVQLRSVGADDTTASIHSKTVDQVIDIYRKPVIDITRAGWTPGGLLVEFTSDYPYGMTYLTIDSIKVDKQEMLKESVTLDGWGSTLSGVIDRDKLKAFIADGASLGITYRTGYDQQKICDGSNYDLITCTYDAGSENVEPLFQKDGSHLYALVPRLGGTSRFWVEYNGTSVECYQVGVFQHNGRMYDRFDVMYPTNGDIFRTFTEVRSEDGSRWGTDVSTCKFRRIAYAWTTQDGETLYLRETIDERPVYSYSQDATYQADNLDSRQFSSVSFAPTKTATLTAYGILRDDDPERTETATDFEGLVGKHTIFRDIKGGIHNAAVTNVTINRRSQYDEITVQMLEETV